MQSKRNVRRKNMYFTKYGFLPLKMLEKGEMALEIAWQRIHIKI